MTFSTEQKVAFIRQMLLGAFVVCYLSNFYYYLSRIDSFFSIDLRNRVVGARLLALDKNPYYFKWDPTQPETLLDPHDKCGIKNNMVTSPPSILLLMRPAVNAGFGTISFYWVVIHYLFFLIIFLAAYTAFRNDLARAGLSMVGIILLFTSQWAQSVFMGQNHFILPAILAICLATASTRHKHRFFYLGLLFAISIWIRPNAVLIFPFLYCCYKVNRKLLIAGFGSGCAMLLLLTVLLNEQQYWIDFYHSCKDWMAYFVSRSKTGATCYFKEIIEGRKFRYGQLTPASWSSQYANIFPIVYRKTGIDIPLPLISFSCVVVYFLALFYWWKSRASELGHGIMMGILLYWLFEICSPIPKITYYYTELFIVALFMAAVFKQALPVSRLLFVLSMVTLFTSFIPANLVLAEMLLMISLAVYLITKYPVRNSHKKNHPTD